jgi:uncharacterized protein (DUF1499 family)
MVILKWLAIGVAALVLLAVLAGQLKLLQGKAPSDLGVRGGRLKAPAKTPNSVSSQAGLYPDHPMRDFAQIAPLPLKSDGPATLARIRQIVEAMPGAKVVKSEPDYLYAQFTTPLMKYVDDVEFWFDPVAGVVQVRSASRVGHGDRGLNRARVEAIRANLAAAP